METKKRRIRTTCKKGSVVHCTSEGRCYSTPENKCVVGISKLEKLLNNGYHIQNARVKKLRTTAPKVVIRLFGELVEVEANTAVKCNFTIETL